MATTKHYSKVTHCIFDNDGTLMDTERLYTQAVQNLLTPYGKIYSPELKMRCMGMSSHLASQLVVNELKLPLKPEEYLVKFDAEVHRLMCNVELLPGVKELLLHLFEHRVDMAVATSASRKTFNLKARNHCDLLAAFRHFVCGDDPELKRGKPEPDIFLLAASRFKPAPRPECCLVFEDSPLGMRGGIAAGMQVVMIPDDIVPPELTKEATLVLRSMAEFEPELFGLPPYDNVSKFTFG
ncbi:GH10332 [Drosophila grimshawi]|uniref:pseudouridine 5'-phosphatase n=2 Tax=Drosophila grimshawi TaxID=7222 RepID=B4JA82_DROGR|nr:GH10332 [Drosophila grimshawi]